MLRGFEELQDRIQSQACHECGEGIGRAESTIGLFMEVWAALEGTHFSVVPAHEAARLLVWRFICTIPNTAWWVLDAAENGQYGVAGALTRLLLEEVVSLIYFASFPKAAQEHVVQSPGKDELDFDGKVAALKRLGSQLPQSINKFYGQLSSLYAHANAGLRPELVSESLNGSRTLYARPSFSKPHTEFFVSTTAQLLLLGMVRASLTVFPELAEARNDWSNRVLRLIDQFFPEPPSPTEEFATGVDAICLGKRVPAVEKP